MPSSNSFLAYNIDCRFSSKLEWLLLVWSFAERKELHDSLTSSVSIIQRWSQVFETVPNVLHRYDVYKSLLVGQHWLVYACSPWESVTIVCYWNAPAQAKSLLYNLE